jgi:hypothetical protein
MKEFFNTIFQTSNERIRNPFIGSLIFSWIAFNWKSITTLIFSTKSIEDRIIYISENFTNIWNQLYFPIIFAFFYVLVLPYLMLGIDILIRFAKTGRKKNLTKEKIQDLLDRQEIAVEERIYEEKKAGNAEMSELNLQIVELGASNEEKLKIINSLKLDVQQIKKEKTTLEQFISLDDSSNSEFTQEQKETLDKEYAEFIKTEDSSYFENIGVEISQFKNVPKQIESIIIERYIMRGLVQKIDDDENRRLYYILTKKGKYFWKNYVLSKSILSKEEQEKWDSQDDLPF